jgi:hypothetical protein
MNAAEFVIWLRGYMEGVGQQLTPDQLQRIRDELAKVNQTTRVR